MKKEDKEIYLILHNIRSAYNVGSLFRTADAVGVEKIFCTGYTPTPTDRFGKKRDDIAKTALGAEEHIQWEEEEDVISLIKKLKQEGIQVTALEEGKGGVVYNEITYEDRTALVLGNEVEGLPQEVCEEADMVAEIPMYGEKTSLNVAVAGGVALYEIHKSRK